MWEKIEIYETNCLTIRQKASYSDSIPGATMLNGIGIPAWSLILVLFSTLGVFAQTEAQPDFFSEKSHDTASLADAVNHFVELGETAAVAQLKKIASQDFASGKVDKTFRVACVAKILWESDETPIAPPQLGMFGGGIAIDRNNEDHLMTWPRYPVAKSGASWFIVVHSGRGGTGFGANARIENYIDHCVANGTFLGDSISVPSAEESRADLAVLLRSERWQNAKGADKRTREALTAQLPKPKN